MTGLTALVPEPVELLVAPELVAPELVAPVELDEPLEPDEIDPLPEPVDPPLVAPVALLVVPRLVVVAVADWVTALRASAGS